MPITSWVVKYILYRWDLPLADATVGLHGRLANPIRVVGGQAPPGLMTCGASTSGGMMSHGAVHPAQKESMCGLVFITEAPAQRQSFTRDYSTDLLEYTKYT